MSATNGGTLVRPRPVTIMRDTTLSFPELFMEVYVEGDSTEQRRFAKMFIKSRCTKADKPEDADLVVFTGGDDVNPSLYGETPHRSTRWSDFRDRKDIELYKLCLEKGIPMFGVCRGAQFLHVMNGGKLYQDIDEHVGDHSIYDIKKKIVIPKVSSVHHQSVIPDTSLGIEVLADTVKTGERWRNPTSMSEGTHHDVEAFFYRDTCCFGVQGHPEYEGYHSFLKWTLDKLEELIGKNPDLELEGRNRRLKKSFREERDARLNDKKRKLN